MPDTDTVDQPSVVAGTIGALMATLDVSTGLTPDSAGGDFIAGQLLRGLAMFSR